LCSAGLERQVERHEPVERSLQRRGGGVTGRDSDHAAREVCERMSALVSRVGGELHQAIARLRRGHGLLAREPDANQQLQSRRAGRIRGRFGLETEANQIRSESGLAPRERNRGHRAAPRRGTSPQPNLIRSRERRLTRTTDRYLTRGPSS
jgi:hypothetical protein